MYELASSLPTELVSSMVGGIEIKDISCNVLLKRTDGTVWKFGGELNRVLFLNFTVFISSIDRGW